MRTQEQNPAYRRFNHMLPPSGLYPARWIDIFSNVNDDMLYEDVEVVFVPRSEGLIADRGFWDEFAMYNRRWLGDLGNSVAGWMEPGGLNPEKVFGGMLAYGFVDQTALDNAIQEFACIEECDWARNMANGLFSEALRGGARNRNSVASALEEQAVLHKAQWANDMLTVFRSEARFDVST